MISLNEIEQALGDAPALRQAAREAASHRGAAAEQEQEEQEEGEEEEGEGDDAYDSEADAFVPEEDHEGGSGGSGGAGSARMGGAAPAPPVDTASSGAAEQSTGPTAATRSPGRTCPERAAAPPGATAASSAMGWRQPSSLLACMMLTMRVSWRIAFWILFGSTKPWEFTSRMVKPKPKP
jgi:hypothetical protein